MELEETSEDNTMIEPASTQSSTPVGYLGGRTGLRVDPAQGNAEILHTGKKGKSFQSQAKNLCFEKKHDISVKI